MLGFFRKSRFQTLRTAYEGVLGTSLDIHIEAETDSDAHAAEKDLLDTIDRLEGVFSVYRPSSEFRRFLKTEGEWVDVSLDLGHVLHSAEEARALSSGAFLPTVEALSLWWRAKEAGAEAWPEPKLDPEEPLWEVDRSRLLARRVSLLPSSLNAIAKGHIIDKAVESASFTKGIRKVLVNLGGDLRHWGEGVVECQVTDPRTGHENGAPLSKARFSNGAIATSGGYRRGFDVEGRHHSHIFNPHSCLPENQILSATAMAETAMEADRWSTILSVMPPEEGLALANARKGIGAIILDRFGRLFQNDVWQRGRQNSVYFENSFHP